MANQLHANQQLNVTDHLDASNNTSRLIMQDDGTLVLMAASGVAAETFCSTQRVTHVIMQGNVNELWQ